LVANEKGDVVIFLIKDNLVMVDKKNVPKPTKLFGEACKITGIIYDHPHIVAVNDKGQILF